MKVRAEALRFGYGRHPVLHGVSLEALAPGRLTALIGPNAAGKSTLLKCLAGLLRAEGDIYLDERPAGSLGRGEYSRLVSYLPQEYPSTAALTVFEAVLLARQHSAAWAVHAEDLEHVAAVLERLGIEPLALRYLSELSGGQRQLVAVAQALAREPRVLLLDEPTSGLDLRHQLDLLGLVRTIAAERAMTVLIAVHDLNLAARYADRVVVLHNGRVHASGTAAEVLTEAMLAEVYGIVARVGAGADGIPLVTALGPAPAPRRPS